MIKQNRINFQKSQKGVGLIEVLATILITVIGLVGLAAMQLRSVRANQNATQQAQAVWIVSDMANRIRANSEGDYTDTAAFNCASASLVAANSAKACSSVYRGGAFVAASAACSPAELVIFDKREVLCGFSQTAPGIVYENAASFLANPSMLILDANNRISIQLNWSERDAQGPNVNTRNVQMVIYK